MQLMFDLDGTLTDSRLGVTRCIQYALAASAVVPSIEELTRYVGPPLPGSFATLLGTSDARQNEEAIAAYRRRFDQIGIFENRLYPGIVKTLEAFEAEAAQPDRIVASSSELRDYISVRNLTSQSSRRV